MPAFPRRQRTLKPVVTLAAIVLFAGSSVAQTPTPTTFVDLPVPFLSGWNDVNTRTIDGISGASSRTIIYPDANAKAVAASDWDLGSVASIFWELDDGSGRAPGLQAVTDDFAFPVNNCIMASGERPFDEGSGELVPKTCSDPQGSSKRYFLEITEADVPVDLVFDLGTKDIRYKGVKDPDDDGGEALAKFRESYGIGRIYRVIQKLINDTDERIARILFEVGVGVGDEFEPLSLEDGVAFEMRELVPREFFEGETGAPDIAVWNPERYATFSPKFFDDGERERFQPGFLDQDPAGFFYPDFDGEHSAFIDSGVAIENGIVGGLTLNYFDMTLNQASAADPPLPGNVFGYMLPDSLATPAIARHDDGDPETESDGIVAWWDGYAWRAGATSILDDHADDDTVVDPFGIIPDSQIEQWAARILGLEGDGTDPRRYESLLSDDLSGLNVDIFLYISEELLDENGQPVLDSITLRATANSVDSLGLGPIPGSEDPEWVKPGNEYPELASYMVADGVPVAINDLATTIETDPVNIDVLLNDLLDGASLPREDVDSVDIVTAAEHGIATIEADDTITYTADNDFIGVDSFFYTVTINDGEGGTETSNEARVIVRVEPAPIPDAPVARNDSALTFTGTPVMIDVLANDDLNNDAPTTVEISVADNPVAGIATVKDGKVEYTPDDGFIGYDRFTYRVTVDGKPSNLALITVQVAEIPDQSPPDDSTPHSVFRPSSSGGCAVGRASGPVDPLLPGMLVIALIGLILRRRRKV